MSETTRRLVFVRQQGLCEVCQRPLSGNFILHHLKNRCMCGPTTPSNLAARHVNCEVIAHRNFKFGNPNGLYIVPTQGITDKPKRVKRSDKRHFNLNLALSDEEYAFRAYCQGRI